MSYHFPVREWLKAAKSSSKGVGVILSIPDDAPQEKVIKILAFDHGGADIRKGKKTRNKIFNHFKMIKTQNVHTLHAKDPVDLAQLLLRKLKHKPNKVTQRLDDLI